MKRGALIALSLAFSVLSARSGEVRVEPAVSVVPANHLKFYLHFPAPMERGDVFRHLRIVEVSPDGTELGEAPEPFREVELWDESFTRMTLWLHPGRQKPGVNLNVEIGPILEEGKHYRLEISGAWRDESGVPTGETVQHPFRAGPPDETRPDPTTWKIEVRKGFVRAETGESLDPESLRKRVSLKRDGAETSRDAKIAGDATGFSIHTGNPLPPGAWSLVIDPRLEDLAGNSIARPFNRDLTGDTVRDATETVEIPFSVPPALVPEPEISR